MNWYLIQTKPKSHQLASRHLKQQGFEVFLPQILKTAREIRKFSTSASPLFPNYLFMGHKSEIRQWKSINSTRGVSRAVTLDGRYRPIDQKLIESLKCRCNSEGIIQETAFISPGDRLKIDCGPFSEFLCEVERVVPDKRVWVLIDLMEQKIRANLKVSDLSFVG